MKTIRARRAVREFLHDGSTRTTYEIYDYVNKRYKSGNVTTCQLINVLGKNPEFITQGLTRGGWNRVNKWKFDPSKVKE